MNKYISQSIGKVMAIALILIAPGVGLAQTEQISPLDLSTPEPLLPQIDRPLSPLERGRITREIEKLNPEAMNELETGNEDLAFDLLYRQLRLQKILGMTSIAEVEELGRIGKIAWERNRPADMEIISERLQEIETEANNQPQLLTALAQAYEKAGYPDKALAVYQQLQIIARLDENPTNLEVILNKIGELNLARFDNNNAALAYEELLTIATKQGNQVNEEIYLDKLAEIYTETMASENAIRVKEQLSQTYLKNQKLDKLATLKISIGDDYTALKKPDPASQNYQEAFALAWELKHFANASEALNKLGTLYRNYDQNQSAIKIYQELVKVEQTAYNLYGLMTTYDNLGQIYLEEENYPQALAAFEAGLALANSLKYQQEYFATQVELIQQKIN